jgi:FkbM family methyltransferase
MESNVKNEYWFNSEIKEQKLVRNLVSGGMTVFDVGTNIGKYTKLFSILVEPKGRVYAFEPTQKSFLQTLQAVQEVGYNNVVCTPKAIFSENTTLTFNEFPDEYSSWNSIGKPHMADPHDSNRIVQIKQSIEVEAITLDSFCRENNIDHIDYLKLDVEGAEIFALRGANNLLKNRKVRYLQFEISQEMLVGLHTDAKTVFDYLYALGYEAHQITDDGMIGECVHDSNDYYNNYIAIPKNLPTSIGLPSENVTTRGNNLKFTDNGLWTPQTYMLQAIDSWVAASNLLPLNALSIDINPDLDSILRQKWAGFAPLRAVYPETDVQNLQTFPDATFDIVYSHQVLEHVPKPWLAASEILRVTRKGGFGIHTTCAFNPRHGLPDFNDYYRFLPDGLAQLFDGVNVLVKGEWGSRQAILYNVGIDDGHGDLGGRRLPPAIGSVNDGLYPWTTWIIYEKT